MHLLLSSSSLECSICRRRYADRSTFLRHQREKHPEPEEDEEGGETKGKVGKADREALAKKFGCNICKKAFKRRITMATHVTR